MTQVKAYIVSTAVQPRILTPKVRAVIPATQGPTGAPGANGSAPEVTAPAGANMSAGRAVVMLAGSFFYFQPTNPAHVGRLVGITKTSATISNPVAAQTGGIISDVSFAFTPDLPVFIGTDGELTTTPPGAGNLVQKVGLSLTAGQILLNFNITLIQI